MDGGKMGIFTVLVLSFQIVMADTDCPSIVLDKEGSSAASIQHSDQGDSGLCYSYLMCKLVDIKRTEMSSDGITEVCSPVALGISTALFQSGAAFRTKGQIDSGWACDAFMASQERGFCSEDSAYHDMANYRKNHTKIIAEIEDKNSKVLNSITKTDPINYLASKWSGDCGVGKAGYIAPLADFRCESESRENAQEFRELILEKLKKKNATPFGIHFCNNLLFRGPGFRGLTTLNANNAKNTKWDTSCDTHYVMVRGMTKGPQGQCRLMLKNTFFDNCAKVHPKWKCQQNGELEVDFDEISQNLFEVVDLVKTNPF